jgi:O-antigen/teichoic acid export membrane protein
VTFCEVYGIARVVAKVVRISRKRWATRSEEIVAHIIRSASYALWFVRGNSNASAVAKNLIIRVALLAVNFGTGVIVARSLGPAGRGEQAAMALWPSFLATMATIGIPTALNYHSRRQPEDAKRLYMSSAVMMLLIGLIASAAGVVAMPLLLRGFDAKTIQAARWLMLFAPETLIASAARAHLDSQGQFSRSTLGFLYPNVATLVGLCSLHILGDLTPLTGALAYIVPPAVQAVWLISRLWQPKLFRVKRILGDMQLLLPYGVRCYGSDIIGAVSSQVDLVVIVAFLSAPELGLYTVALSLSRLISVVHASVCTILFSRASSLQTDDALQLVARAARFATVFCIGLAVVFLLAVPMALPIVYGHRFIEALPLLWPLTAEAVLAGCVVMFNQGFLATGRPGVVTAIQMIWLGTAVALLFVCVPRMNIIGAAVALLAAGVVRFALVMVAYPVLLQRPLPRLILSAADIVYLRTKVVAMRHGRSLASPENSILTSR